MSVRRAMALYRRNATIYKRTYKFNILPNFFEPFFYLIAMGLGLGAYLSNVQDVKYIDFIAPGLSASAALFGSSFEVTFNCFVKMHFGKIYDAVASTPLTPEDVGLGELLWATTRALIYGAAFIGVSAGFGVVHTPAVVLAPFALALIGLMFSVIGLTYTMLVPIIDYFSYYWTMFMTPMFLFSGIFFPLDRLPEWAQALAWFVPLHQAVNLMRALVLTGDLGAAAGAAAWIAVFTAALLVVPLNLIRWRLVK
ncbi:MAG: ABC transporter permease [Actinomycetota bacterium]